jgi:adenylate kinase family enzyme
VIAEHVNLVQLDHPLGKRIGVFGAGGKTTLARAIARRKNIEFIELDQIRNLPGWNLRPVGEFRQIVAQRMAVNPNGWITDHSHEAVQPMIHERADSVIVLQLPFRSIFWRRVKRSLRRAWSGEEVCGGNVETFRQHLLSRDSAILEMWQKRGQYSHYAHRVSMAARSGVDLYVISSAAELDRFYELHGLTRVH